MDPPKEDPRLTDPDITKGRLTTSTTTSDTMPSLVQDRPPFGDRTLTFSDELAALDLSSEASPHPTLDPWAMTAPTTPHRPSSPSPDDSILSELTSPTTGRRITRSGVHPLDRVAFGRQHHPAMIPVKVYYTCRSYIKHGRGPGVTRWRITIHEAYTGAFGDWQIGLTLVIMNLKIVGTHCSSSANITAPTSCLSFPCSPTTHGPYNTTLKSTSRPTWSHVDST
jgi:hypothetical protein